MTHICPVETQDHTFWFNPSHSATTCQVLLPTSPDHHGMFHPLLLANTPGAIIFGEIPWVNIMKDSW